MFIGIDNGDGITIFNLEHLHHISNIVDNKWELVLDDKQKIIITNKYVDAIIDALRMTDEITYIS